MRPDPETITDGYHTMAELYRQRALYHAAWLRAETDLEDTDEWRYSSRPDAVRSKRHADGEPCFDGEYFIVSVKLPMWGMGRGPHGRVEKQWLSKITTQVAQHYPLSEWELFGFLPEVATAPEWDGHTPSEGNARLADYLKGRA